MNTQRLKKHIRGQMMEAPVVPGSRENISTSFNLPGLNIHNVQVRTMVIILQSYFQFVPFTGQIPED